MAARTIYTCDVCKTDLHVDATKRFPLVSVSLEVHTGVSGSGQRTEVCSSACAMTWLDAQRGDFEKNAQTYFEPAATT
jgi:hypothetical protein